jgi:DNA-binding MarR family transcriptional regulator
MAEDDGGGAGSGLGEVLEFMSLLWAVEHGLQRTSKRMARELGLTGPQRVALRLIARFPGISPSELASRLRLHPSTVTGIVLRLERRRMIERRPHATDRRRAHLFVRADGQRLNRRSAGTVEEAVKRLLARVGRQRLQTAGGVLTELAAILKTHVEGR